MNDQNKPTIPEVEPYSFAKAALILIAFALFDTVGCVILLVGSLIFMKMGHKGLAMAMCIVNLMAPDALPFVDEIFQIVVIAVPLYNSFQEKKNKSLPHKSDEK